MEWVQHSFDLYAWGSSHSCSPAASTVAANPGNEALQTWI